LERRCAPRSSPAKDDATVLAFCIRYISAELAYGTERRHEAERAI
jgi:hypothetical protein